MQRRATWLVMLTVTAFLALLAGILILPRLLYPPLSPADLRAVPTAKERIDLQQAQAGLQNTARNTLLQGAGGLLLVAAAVATWRQVQVAREGQITERFTRAVDQLGSDKLDIRLGGILALERVAKNSEMDREAITRILEVFVRTHAPWSAAPAKDRAPHPHGGVDDQIPWLRDRAPDLQVCLIVLGRRVASRSDKPAHLARTDLRHSYLSRSRLSGATLRFANLARAEWRQVHLEESRLAYADLRQSDMRDGFLLRADLSHAWLDEADFRSTDLRRTSLVEACLREADLRGADLRNASLRGADLRGANLDGARLEGADLTGACEDAMTNWPAALDAARRREAGVVAKGEPASEINPTAGAS